MLTSIRQTHSEFFRQFHNLKIMVGDKSITLLSRYARSPALTMWRNRRTRFIHVLLFWTTRLCLAEIGLWI